MPPSTDTVAAMVNPALVVVREGVEAVLIVASLGTSLNRAAGGRLRVALLAGVGIAALATVATWLGAGALLSALGGFGRYVEAGVSIFSSLLLLLITNWFFHRVYWTGWVARFHAQKRRRLAADGGQLAGMVLLGFSSTYREGFETVLFLQALALQTSGVAVGTGAIAGTILVLMVGGVVLGLQVRLPYRRMLVATGLMISAVLVMMVGNTVHAMQEVGWMSTTRALVEPPAWAGAWLGFYGSIEGVCGQVLAAAVVFGSYWLAEQRHLGATTRPWLTQRRAGILISQRVDL